MAFVGTLSQMNLLFGLDRAVRVRALAEAFVSCSWTNLMLGGNPAMV